MHGQEMLNVERVSIHHIPAAGGGESARRNRAIVWRRFVGEEWKWEGRLGTVEKVDRTVSFLTGIHLLNGKVGRPGGARHKTTIDHRFRIATRGRDTQCNLRQLFPNQDPLRGADRFASITTASPEWVRNATNRRSKTSRTDGAWAMSRLAQSRYHDAGNEEKSEMAGGWSISAGCSPETAVLT